MPLVLEFWFVASPTAAPQMFCQGAKDLSEHGLRHGQLKKSGIIGL